MMASSLAKASSWRRRSGVSLEQRNQRVRQRLRRAVVLHELRHDILPDHQIGQDDGRHPDEAPRPPWLRARRPCKPRPSARPPTQARAWWCRISPAPPARCASPRASPPRSTTMRGLIGQVDVACLTCSTRWRHGRHHHVERPVSLFRERERRAEIAGQPPHLAAAAADHGKHHRRIGHPPPRFRFVGPQAARPPRSADGRHRCRAARRAACARRARTAAAPAHDRCSRASSAPVLRRQAQTEGDT